jgi:pilus assembly protein CpaB
MRRPGIIFLFAIVIGALLSALVYGNLKSQREELERARLALQRGTVDVLVASQPITIGSRIDAAQVRAVRWPEDIQPQGAIRDAKAVVGRIARTAIDSNQPIVDSQLVGEGTGLLPLLITEGMRGISVKVDDVTGVSGFITPNSRVDVLVSGSDGMEGSEQKSRVILQNVKVLAIGKSIEQKDEKPVEVPTVTLLVTPADAERLTLATRQEPVRLALRNFRDEEYVGTPGISTRALFGYAPPPEPAPVIAKAKPRKAPPAPYVVDVLLGTKVMRQEFGRGGEERVRPEPPDLDVPGDKVTESRQGSGGTFGG